MTTMTITALISALTEMLDKHGDIPVYDTDAHEIIGISEEAPTGASRIYIEAHF